MLCDTPYDSLSDPKKQKELRSLCLELLAGEEKERADGEKAAEDVARKARYSQPDLKNQLGLGEEPSNAS